MKCFISFSVICAALFSSIQAEEFPAQEILEMAEKDSEARKTWMCTRDITEVRAQEIENTARLKEFIFRCGLPDEDDDEVVDAIQQLVLHSSDLEFQKQILEKISSAGNLWNDYAVNLLTDRILLRQGLPQRYGTHVHHEAGLLVPYPIEDLKKVEERQGEDEPSFAESLEAMREVDRAIAQNNDSNLHKVWFNMRYHFFKKATDYLYYATFEPNGTAPEENGNLFAFEDPGLAATFALYKTTLALSTVSYEKSPYQHLLVSIAPQNSRDAALLCEMPLYIYLVSREHFQPYMSCAVFSERVLASSQKVEPVAEIQCDSAIEAMVIGGCKLRVYGPGWEQVFENGEFRKEFLSSFLFDITLENEHFDSM